MSQFIIFPEEMGDIEVNVEINATLHDLVSLLLLINFAGNLGIEEVGDLSGIYEDLMTQLSIYGSISSEGDIEDE
jgi:hypothetical protein